MSKKSYVVRGIDLKIDGVHVPEGSTVALELGDHPHLERWLVPADAKAKDATKTDKGDKT